jgi:hypothetical protein
MADQAAEDPLLRKADRQHLRLRDDALNAAPQSVPAMAGCPEIPPPSLRPSGACPCGCGNFPRQPSGEGLESRRSFLKKASAAALAGLFGAQRALGQSSSSPGHPAAWARLITPYFQWNRHGTEDAALTKFLQEAGLPFAPVGPAFDLSDLADLRPFALLHTNQLTAVEDPDDIAKLREYAYGGGFIYVDACGDTSLTKSCQDYHDQHLALLARMLPGSEVRILSGEHPIFHRIFQVDESALIPNPEPSNPSWAGARRALYGVYDDDHMVALLSQANLRCSWTRNQAGYDPKKVALKLREVANIYAYALSR